MRQRTVWHYCMGGERGVEVGREEQRQAGIICATRAQAACKHIANTDGDKLINRPEILSSQVASYNPTRSQMAP